MQLPKLIVKALMDKKLDIFQCTFLVLLLYVLHICVFISVLGGSFRKQPLETLMPVALLH